MRNPNRAVPADVQARMRIPGSGHTQHGAGSGAPQVSGITLQRYAPEIYPIPEARSFALFDAVDMLAGAGSTATPNGLRLALPAGYSAVVRMVSIDMNDITTATDVRYTVRVGGAGVPGFDQLRHFPRSAASVSREFEAFIPVPDGQTVDVLITNNDGGAYKVGMSLVGWSWPTGAGRRWLGEGA